MGQLEMAADRSAHAGADQAGRVEWSAYPAQEATMTTIVAKGNVRTAILQIPGPGGFRDGRSADGCHGTCATRRWHNRGFGPLSGYGSKIKG